MIKNLLLLSTITCGVPQGSILGPLLFIIYINDMHKASSLQCIHYADDTTLFSKGNNLDDLIDLTNNELVKIDKWVCANKLSLNINKTALSICSTKAVTDVRRVKIRNVEINLVNNFKFLGIIIDSNLSLSSHYQNICNKTSRSSSVLSKLGSYVPQPILRKTVSNYDLSTLKLWHRNLGKLVQNGNKKDCKESKINVLKLSVRLILVSLLTMLH